MTNEATWRERLQRWESSGLSAREFSSREGVARHALYNWKKRFEAKKPAAAALVPVRIGSTAPPFEVVVGSRVVVRVPPDFDEGGLARLVRALEDVR